LVELLGVHAAANIPPAVVASVHGDDVAMISFTPLLLLLTLPDVTVLLPLVFLGS
jgi:hypothetical protein